MLTMPTVTPSEPSAPVAELHFLASHVIGDVLMPSDARMRFPMPLFGLPDHTEYALLPAARSGLWWLQALNDPSLAFLLADPFRLDGSYGVDVGDVERGMLRLEAVTDSFALVMITLPSDGQAEATANFRAPLVFNLREGVGLQVVARDDGYSLRRPVDLRVFPPQANGLRMQ
jgi:flagellar assembly factor FliW